MYCFDIIPTPSCHHNALLYERERWRNSAFFLSHHISSIIRHPVLQLLCSSVFVVGNRLIKGLHEYHDIADKRKEHLSCLAPDYQKLNSFYFSNIRKEGRALDDLHDRKCLVPWWKEVSKRCSTPVGRDETARKTKHRSDENQGQYHGTLLFQ